jgi:phosphate:Na+ symporter
MIPVSHWSYLNAYFHIKSQSLIHISDIWKFLAGIGFFMLGLQQMDMALSRLAGRPFKTFLRRTTSTFFRSVTGGALITALLQSSSVVALITLGFVEAGLIPFRNALGVIMGSNLGSTMISWIVATVGFRLDIESIAIPGIAVGTIGMFFSGSRKNIYNSFRFLFSISVLFLGLAFMKETAERLFANFDITAYQHYPLIVFLLIGFIITSLVQTSSATMAIALTALHSHVLTLPAAAAVVIGSETGTALKTLIAGINGSGEKKSAAFGNFYFNIVTTLLSFIFIRQLLHFITGTLGITDPLISLASFQTLINFLTILLFIPFINRFSEWLEKRFSKADGGSSYVRADLDQYATITPAVIRDEVDMMLRRTLDFHDLALDTGHTDREGLVMNFRNFAKRSGATREAYDKLKRSEGELLEICLQFNDHELSLPDQQVIDSSMDAMRQIIHSAKSVKDIHHNMDVLRESAKDQLHDHFHRIGREWTDFRERLLSAHDPQALAQLLKQAYLDHERNNEMIRDEIRENKLEDIEASTMMNIEREILSSKKSLISAWEKLNFEPSS